MSQHVVRVDIDLKFDPTGHFCHGEDFAQHAVEHPAGIAQELEMETEIVVQFEHRALGGAEDAHAERFARATGAAKAANLAAPTSAPVRTRPI